LPPLTKSFTITVDEHCVITVKAEFFATVNEAKIPKLVDINPAHSEGD
jgi:hypothetical protein